MAPKPSSCFENEGISSAAQVKCLEVSQATGADVFLYWLAVLSSFEQIMKENDELSRLGIPEGEVQGILNFHYQEMLEAAGKGIYMAMLFLDTHKQSKYTSELKSNITIEYIQSSIFTKQNPNPIDT